MASSHKICFKAPIRGCGRVARVPELQGQVGQLFRAGRGKVKIDYHALDRIFSGRAQTSQISTLIFHFYCFFSCIQQQIQALEHCSPILIFFWCIVECVGCYQVVS